MARADYCELELRGRVWKWQAVVAAMAVVNVALAALILHRATAVDTGGRYVAALKGASSSTVLFLTVDLDKRTFSLSHDPSKAPSGRIWLMGNKPAPVEEHQGHHR
jgi:anti-sigma-K factor RskA